MKKLTALFLACAMALSLAACAGSGAPAETSGEASAKASAVVSEKPSNTADSYPSDTITIVCPWAVGGNADIACRLIADLLGKELGGTIIVENTTGSGGQVATIEYMDAKSDGYTLIYSSDVLRFLTPRVMKVDYDYTQLQPICTTATNGFGVIVNPSTGVTNLEELKAYADKNGSLTCAVTGKTGAITYELMNALFKEMGIQAEFMVFGSGAEVATEVLGGHVDTGIAIDPLCDQYVQEGTLNYIATFLEDGRQIENGAAIPSCVAQGYSLSNANPNMLCYKTGTPQEIVDKLTTAMENISDELATQLEETGYTPKILFGNELDTYLNQMDQSYAEMTGVK